MNVLYKNSKNGSVTVWLLFILIILGVVAYYLNQNHLIPNFGPISKYNPAPTPEPSPVIDWNGIYSYTQPLATSSISYILSISPETAFSYTVIVNINGPSTQQQLNAIGRNSNNHLIITFDSYKPGNQTTPYFQGDWLLSLQQTGTSSFKAIWNKVKPPVENTDNDYFTRSN